MKKSDSELDSKRIESLLHNIYEKDKPLHSTSAEARLIEHLSEQGGPLMAAAALAVRLNQPLTLHRQHPTINPAILQGAIRMTLFLEGIDSRTPKLLKSKLSETLQSYGEHLDESTHQADELKRRLDDLVGEHSKMRDRGLAAMATAVRLARKQARQQQSEAENRLMELVKMYNEKLSLDAPVNCWRSKCLRHRRWATGLFLVFGGLMGSTAILVYQLARNTGLGDLGFWQSADLSAIALLTVSVGIVVAVVRIPLRLAMSELHLGNDAEERVTMVNTYLALRAGEHTTAEHMAVILDRLFKPAADGIVKDDFGPVTAADALGKVLQR